jgi:hypothetical protein
MSIGNHAEISKIVKYLSTNYVLSQNQNYKKGGLIGLAACAIALGKVSLNIKDCKSQDSIVFLTASKIKKGSAEISKRPGSFGSVVFQRSGLESEILRLRGVIQHY